MDRRNDIKKSTILRSQLIVFVVVVVVKVIKIWQCARTNIVPGWSDVSLYFKIIIKP